MDINDCIIIDVRTREEFMGGHVAGSKNIPLLEILEHEEELKKMKQPIIFCCVSGARSGQAANYFKQKGIECENGGSWLEVNYKVSQ
ncbi:MAG TPA: rhodanese-like domain-containing protein [Flavobacteriaceae bacterium]|nr:rhodanese-like domain-containing protein [Flavobacteriaceae bacterium]